MDTQCLVPPSAVKEFPILDVNSDNLRCRSNSIDDPDIVAYPVDAGSVITLWWQKDSLTPVTQAEPTAPLGPCAVYLARYSGDADTLRWFKVYQNGYVKGNWCSTAINNAGGFLNLILPWDIVPGTYMMRAEIIDLHYAMKNNFDDYTQGPQFFPSCAKLEISGNGTSVPSGRLIPGLYDINDPSLNGDFLNSPDGYKVPGPPEYKPAELEAKSITSDDNLN
ncbi:hypothetical protein GGI07_002091 [Coemansia sp. Benny D115]|nr:hypothetical protein GGI07_002091 [Coemansia sp. Benny D115]